MATAYKHGRTIRALTWCLSLVLLTIPSATGAKVPAQSQDSLHDRLDFLKTNLERYLSHSLGVGESADLGSLNFEAVNFETCKINWTITTEFGHGAEVPVQMRDLTLVNRVTLNLSSLDASRTKIYVMEQMKQRNIPWSLVLQLTTRPGTPGFIQQLTTTKRGQANRTAVLQERQLAFFFNLRDQRIAEEVSKAFADAGAICRSRAQTSR